LILYLLGFVVFSPHLNQRLVLGIDITLHSSLLLVSDMNNYWMVWIGNPTWHHSWTNLTWHYVIVFLKLFLSDTTEAFDNSYGGNVPGMVINHMSIFCVVQKFKMATTSGQYFGMGPYWKTCKYFFLRNYKFNWIQTVNE